MMTFDGMSIEAIALFHKVHPAPRVGVRETGRVDGHRFTISEETAGAEEDRRFRIKLTDGRITHEARYAITHGGKKITGLGEVTGNRA